MLSVLPPLLGLMGTASGPRVHCPALAAVAVRPWSYDLLRWDDGGLPRAVQIGADRARAPEHG
ncbi:MAG: hypothetical protein M0026_01810 [Nocardiopsaceae bacterium]|nr:hypothetical protein [Nocardiopsaceae bacterium]